MPILTNVLVTAYCLCSHCCSPANGGLAANGRAPIQGVTVAGPRSYPLESKVTIYFNHERRRESRKEFNSWPLAHKEVELVLQDRTAAKYDGRFDIYFRSHAEAKRFGIRRADVRITLPKKRK